MKIVTKFINPVIIILLSAIFRLIPHVPNFTPITAMALFGGVYLGKKYALLIPLLAMILSDYLLLYINPFSTHMFNFSYVYPPQTLWYSNTIVAVYGSFLISGLIGLLLKKHKSITNVVLASFIASIQFFLITNAAVWMSGMYDRSILGLWESYIAGIPFFRFTLAGDLFYTVALFGTYELVLRTIKSRKLAFTK
ncbi:MAG TPA: DUF6580 family putative transport protein [Patescibacteria group bacterium]|nr:DUF6580 family putative transport protein [Patescibacteria group bacterium]